MRYETVQALKDEDFKRSTHRNEPDPADLAVIPFVVAMFAPLLRGNIVRMVIAGTLELIVGFYLATWMSPLFTSAAVDAGFKMPDNALSITSIVDGFIWVQALYAQLVKYVGVFGLVILAVLLGVAMFFYTKNTQAWEVAVGAPEEVVAAPAAKIAGRAMSFGTAAEIEHI